MQRQPPRQKLALVSLRVRRYRGRAKLRLAQFRPDAEVAELDNWEFMGRIWVGEAVGCSEWLRLEVTPETLRSLAIDFSEFPEQDAAEVLRTMTCQSELG